VTAVHADARSPEEHDRHTLPHAPAEPLREQIFAACGYAFAIAATVAGLLTPHLGRRGLACAIALTALLVPVNVIGIRRFARLRRSLSARQSATPGASRARATPRRHVP
jgi:hypothetical protein